jgi:tetratricopeptide (TPR) repeat protein
MNNSHLIFRTTRLGLVLAAIAASFQSGLLADEVRRINGERHTGTIQTISPNEVTIGGSVREVAVPANEIAAVVFSREPRGLADAREAYATGRYTNVFSNLGEIKPEEIRRDEVKAEIEFYRAMAAARMASFGNVDQKTAMDAGRDLLAFLRDHKDSYHYYEANEALGDLLSALKNPNAFTYYDVVATAPWPDYRPRAGVLKGRAAAMHGNHKSAIEHFDAALAAGGMGRAVETQFQLASIGKASSMAETGQVDDGMKLLQEVIAKADEGDREVYARAYNALGACYRKKNRPKDALLEYLKVDLLFSSNPDAHAEALYNLAQLWNEVQRPERARAAADTLKQRYATSRWNKG